MIKYQLSLGYLRPACYINGVYRLLSTSPERNEVELTDCTGNVIASLSCEFPNIEAGELVQIQAKVWTPPQQAQRVRIDWIEHVTWQTPLPKSVIRLPALHTRPYSQNSEELVRLVDENCTALQKWQLRALLEKPAGSPENAELQFPTDLEGLDLPTNILCPIRAMHRNCS